MNGNYRVLKPVNDMKYLYYILIILVLAAVQLTVIPYFRFGSFGPDLLTILVAVFALKYGRVQGMLNGFFIGLLFDLISGGTIGLSSFSKTINGFIAGSFYIEDRKELLNNAKFLLIILLCSTVDNFSINILSGGIMNLNFLGVLFTYGLLPGIYTTIISSPLLLIKERIL